MVTAQPADTQHSPEAHYRMARAWVCYSSVTGRATEKQIARAMKTPAVTLAVLLARRGLAY